MFIVSLIRLRIAGAAKAVGIIPKPQVQVGSNTDTATLQGVPLLLPPQDIWIPGVIYG